MSKTTLYPQYEFDGLIAELNAKLQDRRLRITSVDIRTDGMSSARSDVVTARSDKISEPVYIIEPPYPHTDPKLVIPVSPAIAIPLDDDYPAEIEIVDNTINITIPGPFVGGEPVRHVSISVIE